MQNILKTLQKIKTTYIPSDTQTTTVLMFILLELCSLLRVKLTENEVFGGFLLTKTITAFSHLKELHPLILTRMLLRSDFTFRLLVWIFTLYNIHMESTLAD